MFAVRRGVPRYRVHYATTPTSSGTINPVAVPLGDGYVSTTPRVGYVDAYQTTFGGGGAIVDGPWINTRNHTWDYRTKLEVNGRIKWPNGSYRVRTAHGRRVIKFNDLPTHDVTGIFPIRQSDPVYGHDFNPNHIASHTFDWTLPEHPKAAKTPTCANMGPSACSTTASCSRTPSMARAATRPPTRSSTCAPAIPTKRRSTTTTTTSRRAS